MSLEGSDPRPPRDPVGSRRLRSHGTAHRTVAALLALVVVGAGAGATLQARALEQERARNAATQRATAALTDVLAEVEVLSERLLEREQQGTPVRIEDRHLVAPEGALRGFGVDARASLLDGVSTARDLGTPEIAAVAGDDGVHLFVILPRFKADIPATSTQARREAFLAAELVEIDTDTILEPVGDISIHASLDGTELATRVPRGQIAAATGDADLLDHPLVVTAAAAVPLTVGVSWWYLALACGIAGLIVVAAWILTRRVDRAETDRRRADRDRALLTEAGSVLGSSLDLSDTMPGVALMLMDAFSLGGVVVSRRNSAGELEPVFSVGTRPEAGSAPSIVLPLGRSGREFGELVVQPRRMLTAEQIRTLETIGDLVAAAIANASLLDAERGIVEELNRVDALKTDFLATVSHEVRTPLASIIGFSTLLRGSWDHYSPEQIRDFVARIDLNAVSLSAMLSEILDFSRLERGALQVEPGPIDVTSVLRDVVTRNGPMFDGHRIEVHAPESLQAIADRAALEQVVSNLLTNAVKFSPQGSRIGVTASKRAGGVRIVVDDEGPGVLPEERERIFDRFFRGTSDLARKTRGAGIGLAVVADLVHRMSGTVHVEESSSGGAAFVLELKPVEAPVRRPVEARSA